MALSSDLLSQLVKATKPTERKPTEGTVYGTIVEQDDSVYVQLDGSDALTPVSSTVKMKSGERVIVAIKNHTAVVTGNLTVQAARSDDVDDIVDEIADFEIIIADKVSTEEFDAVYGRIDNLVSDNVLIRGSLTAMEATVSELDADNVVINEKLTANEAAIENLEATSLTADIADLKYASISDLDAVNAVIYNLDATYATITDLSVARADIDDLKTTKLSAEQADLRYAAIDFANIGEAAIEKLFADSGIIKDLVVSEGHITGELVGVTIKGDLIQGETIVAEKLMVRGEDGLYYKLNLDGETIESEQTDSNSLNGSVITAKSITASKVNVDDLVAFHATIGGFHITDDAIHSGVKESISNSTNGIFLGKDGQFAIGNDKNYIKYYKDANSRYKLDIAAESIVAQIKNATEALTETMEKVQKHFSFTESGLKISAGENTMSIRIDNDIVVFEKNNVQFGWWDGIDFHTGNIMIDVTERAQFGNFAFVPRSDGSLSFLKVADNAGFYATLRGGIMVMYGSYPTLEDTTMVLGDIAAELTNTTLKLGG